MSEDDTQDPKAATDSTPPPPRRGWFRRLFGGLITLTVVMAIVCVGLAIGGFLRFSIAVQNSKDLGHLQTADGIVVLTGGAQRLTRGLELLSLKVSDRLLISGVNENTSIDSLKARYDNEHQLELFDCCIEIGKQAVDTRGNATEANDWIAANGLSRILMVTSAYHVPRALFEFRRQIPAEIEIQAVPVHVADLPLKSWWKSATAIRVLMREYTKFLLARARENRIIGPYIAAYT